MNEAELTKLEVKLKKACRWALFCGVLIIMALMLSLMTGKPVDEKAIAELWTPSIMLVAIIVGIFQFLHSGVKAKLKQIRP